MSYGVFGRSFEVKEFGGYSKQAFLCEDGLRSATEYSDLLQPLFSQLNEIPVDPLLLDSSLQDHTTPRDALKRNFYEVPLLFDDLALLGPNCTGFFSQAMIENPPTGCKYPLESEQFSIFPKSSPLPFDSRVPKICQATDKYGSKIEPKEEVRITCHVRSAKNRGWDLEHSAISFSSRSKIGKFRNFLVSSSSDDIRSVFVELIDANEEVIPESEGVLPLFQLSAEKAGYDRCSQLILPTTHIKSQGSSFYLFVNYTKRVAADSIQLRVRVISTMANRVVIIPLVAGDHKHPSGKKQSKRLQSCREALVSSGSNTSFSRKSYTPNTQLVFRVIPESE